MYVPHKRDLVLGLCMLLICAPSFSCVCICVQGSDSSFPSQLEVTVLTCQSPSLVRAAMDGAAELVNMDHLTRIQVVCINRKQGPLDHVMAEEGVCLHTCTHSNPLPLLLPLTPPHPLPSPCRGPLPTGHEHL